MGNKTDGCEFGRLLQKDFTNFKSFMTSKIDEVIDNQKDLFNHQSSRVPLETVQEMKTQWKIITILSSVLCVCLGVLGTFIVALFKAGGV